LHPENQNRPILLNVGNIQGFLDKFILQNILINLSPELLLSYKKIKKKKN